MRNRLAACLLAATVFHSTAEAQKKPLTKAEVETIVRSYLLEHPEILIEMTQILRAKQETDKRTKSDAALKKSQAELYADAATPASGAPANAPGTVTIVQFFDYRCGYCKRVAPTLQKLAAEDPKLRIVYKEFPILGEQSVAAAKAALAAQKQNAYLPFHRALMKAGDLSQAGIEKAAAEAGLDVDRLKKDMQSAEWQAAVDRTHALAAALAIEATPAFVIGTEIVPGAIDEASFKQLIAKARATKN